MRSGEYFKIYTVPTKQDLEVWVAETFQTPPFDTAVEFQKAHLGPDPSPHMYWFPKNGELLVVGHHNHWDVTAIWHFWNSYLELVTNPIDVVFGDEWKNLPLSRDDLLGFPKHPTLSSYAKAMEIVTAEFKENLVDLPVLNAIRGPEGEILPNGPHGNCTRRFALTREETAALIWACKQRNASITSAFFAAAAICTRKIQQEHGKAGKYAICFHNFDSRAWFKKEAGALPNIGNDLHTIIPFAVDVEQPFEEVLTYTNNKFKSLRKEFHDPNGLDALYHVVKGLVNPHGDIATFPNFTSFGLADRVIQRRYDGPTGGWIQVDDWYQAIENLVQGMNILYICNWRGQLQMGICFNEAYHSEDMLRRLVKDTFHMVLTNFGVEFDLNNLQKL
jgi:hypothetical protein